MKNYIQRFEYIVLRPLLFLYILFAVVSMLGAHWLRVTGAVFCIGIIGFLIGYIRLKQSGWELTDEPRDPVPDDPSVKAQDFLSGGRDKIILRRASGAVSGLLGVTVGVIPWNAFGWPWHTEIIAIVIAAVLFHILMRIYFREIWEDEKK